MSALVRMLSKREAQTLTDDIKSAAKVARRDMARVADLVDEARNANVYQVLGYVSWTAYLAETLGEAPLKLDRAERKEVVAMLAGQGLTVRAIAPIVGVSHMTAQRDLPPVTPVTPQPSQVDVITAEIVYDEPRRRTGLDGKSYASSQTPRTPNRRPLTDAARDAGWDLRRAADRISKLREDDRFSRNKEEVAAHIRGHLMSTIEVCQDLLDELNQSGKD